MLRENQRLDSYQNLICSPAENESIEAVGSGRDDVERVSHVGGYMEVATIYGAEDSRWRSDEDAERIASDLAAGPGEDDRRRKPRPAQHDALAPIPTTHDEEGHGRAASGDPFEDEADDALIRKDHP